MPPIIVGIVMTVSVNEPDVGLTMVFNCSSAEPERLIAPRLASALMVICAATPSSPAVPSLTTSMIPVAFAKL